MAGETKDIGAPIPDDPAGTVEEGTESVRRTIVGGRPLDRRRRKVRIPIGIEKVLCAAAADREFREQLLMARADALSDTGLEVSDAEAMILRSVSEDALRVMIENIDLKRHKRRRFFRGIAAASLAATTAVGIAECTSQSAGVDPVEVEDHFDSMGIKSDVPDVIVGYDTPPSEGDTGDDPFQDVGDTHEIVATDVVPPDEVSPPDSPETIVGSDTMEPTDVREIQVDDVQTYAGVTLPDTNAQDADKVDVDVQPVPAGIPPMEDVKEPE